MTVSACILYKFYYMILYIIGIPIKFRFLCWLSTPVLG